MGKLGKQSKKIILKSKKSKKKNQRVGRGSCKVPVFFIGGSSNLPHPINTNVADPRAGIYIHQPNMNGGKSKRKGKGTRKRVKK